jgi:hypothetical protein
MTTSSLLRASTGLRAHSSAATLTALSRRPLLTAFCRPLLSREGDSLQEAQAGRASLLLLPRLLCRCSCTGLAPL